MLKHYNPLDWYWQADDGRVFSSARSEVMTADDETFTSWKEDGTKPSRWPLDEKGQQTSASLQAVIAPYGLFASLADYATAKRYEIENTSILVKIGGADAPVSTARADRDGLRDTLTAIGLGWRKDGSPFKFADGVFRPANNDEIKAACGAAFAFVQAVFSCENAIADDLSGSDPKIKNRAQIDALFAAAVKATS